MLLFTCVGGAKAQETLTVCDGTDNNSNVPFYGLYADTDYMTVVRLKSERLLGGGSKVGDAKGNAGIGYGGKSSNDTSGQGPRSRTYDAWGDEDEE